MKTAAAAFLMSMLCAAFLTPIIRRLAHRFGALDHALTSRKIHGKPIPRLGGIAIVIGFYAPLTALLVFKSDVGGMFLDSRNFALGMFVGGLLIALLGVYDDVRGTGAGKKFIVQFAVAGLMYQLGVRVDVIANPFGGAIDLGWMSLPVTLLWIVGVINAMNLIDGLDGLAGGVALVAVCTIFLVSMNRVEPLMILFSAALAGAILGFLFYNFNPASIFMGDTGSMFLGFVLATSSLHTGQKSSTAIAVVIPMLILGFPLLDTALAMGRRAIQGRPIFSADKEHIHHRLLNKGLSQRQAVLVLYTMCLLLAAVALTITYAENPTITVMLLGGVAMMTVIFLRRLGYARFGVRQLGEQRRRNLALRAAVRALGERLRAAKRAEEVWELVRESIQVFEASAVRLELAMHAGQPAMTRESSPAGEDPKLTVKFRLVGSKHGDGLLELTWRDGRAELDRDLEIAIELLCEAVTVAHERIQARPQLLATAS